MKIMELPIVILAGGLGTRMREASESLPKPMISIGGKPMLWHIIRNLSYSGAKQFIICAGYKSEKIKEYFLNFSALNSDFTIDLKKKSLRIHDAEESLDIKVTVCFTGEQTQTGGRIKAVKDYIESDNFLVTYGDGIADIDISKLLQFHCNHGKIATVSTSRPFSRFGVMDFDETGKVKSFREKPQVEDWVNIGYFIFKKEFFDYLGVDSVLETTPLEALTRKNELMAFKHEGFWQAMDTPREATMLNELWNSGSAAWKNW
jgi:glucose-1-phosphate cytidylyltransferase